MSEELRKKPFFERMMNRQGYVRIDSGELNAKNNKELEKLIRLAIKDELKEMPRDTKDITLLAVAETVKEITPELQMDVRDVTEFLAPQQRHKQYLALQGDDVNRQVLVEVADLHLAITALEKALVAYDENRRADGHYLTGYVVNAIRDEFKAEREMFADEDHETAEIAYQVARGKPDHPNIIIPLLIMTAFNFLMMLILFLVLR